MSQKIIVTCPVCGEDMTVRVWLIDDCEGAPEPYGPPGGMRNFTTLDAYLVIVGKDGKHAKCVREIDSDDTLNSELEDSLYATAWDEAEQADAMKGYEG